MKHIIHAFLERHLSRREFAAALAGLGFAAASVESVVRAVEGSGPGGAATTRKGTGGELLVAQMIEAGVKFVFTNPGSYEVGFFDALFEKRREAHLIMGLHEGVVIAMADGYHKVSRQPAFVNLHAIAGTAQAAGQMYNASRDGSALVVTAGLLDNEVFNDNIVLGPRPGFNQKDVNRQFTKLSWESHDPRGVPAMLRRAFTLASAPPSGPVYLAFPNTVLEGKGKADILPRQRFTLSDDVPPDPKRVDDLARMLLAAKKPALLLGDEVYKTDAMDEALELAELLSLPVHESTRPAFHCFPRQHPLFKKKFTAYETGDKNKGKAKGKDFDFVLNVGDYDVGDHDLREIIRPVPEYPLYEHGTKVARVGLNPAAHGRNAGFDLTLLASVKRTLLALLEAVKNRGGPAARAWKGQRRKPVELKKEHRGMDPLHPDELGWALNRVLDPKAIIVSENLSGSNDFLWTGGTDAKLWVGNSGAGLGWGVGAATGAKLAAPNRQVVCNIGDGSVMYSACGFWTQARYRIPVLTVVCNNLNYQTVRHAYWRYQGKMVDADKYPGMFLGDPAIDFVKLARSQDVDGIKVTESKDLERALRQGVKETTKGNPFLVEVVVRTVGGGAGPGDKWHDSYQLARKKG